MSHLEFADMYPGIQDNRLLSVLITVVWYETSCMVGPWNSFGPHGVHLMFSLCDLDTMESTMGYQRGSRVLGFLCAFDVLGILGFFAFAIHGVLGVLPNIDACPWFGVLSTSSIWMDSRIVCLESRVSAVGFPPGELGICLGSCVSG